MPETRSNRKRSDRESDRTTAHEGGLGERHETIPQGDGPPMREQCGGIGRLRAAFGQGSKGRRESKSACTRPIRSASLASSAGVIIALHWRASPRGFPA